MCALRTPTLPPATHTNAWIVPVGGRRGGRRSGAPESGRSRRACSRCSRRSARGSAVREVWLTHVHADHVGAAAAVADGRRDGLGHALARGRVPGAEVVPFREGDLAGARSASSRPRATPASTSPTSTRTPARSCAAISSRRSRPSSSTHPRGTWPSTSGSSRGCARSRRGRSTRRTVPPRPMRARGSRGPRGTAATREALVVAPSRPAGPSRDHRARLPRVPEAVHPVAARSCLAVIPRSSSRRDARAPRALASRPSEVSRQQTLTCPGASRRPRFSERVPRKHTRSGRRVAETPGFPCSIPGTSVAAQQGHARAPSSSARRRARPLRRVPRRGRLRRGRRPHAGGGREGEARPRIGAAGNLVQLQLTAPDGELLARPRLIAPAGKTAELVLHDPARPGEVRLTFRVEATRVASGDIELRYALWLPRSGRSSPSARSGSRPGSSRRCRSAR